jgi:predicted transcriptional regulator
MQIDMSGIEAYDVEAMRALVEITWKQENLDRISNEMKSYLVRITDEIKKSIENKVLAEVAMMIDARITKELREDIRRELSDEIREYTREIVKMSESEAATRIAAEIKSYSEQQGKTGRKNVRLYFIGLSLASICLGAAIASVAILAK